METMLLIKLAVALIIGAVSAYLLYNPFRHKPGFDAWSTIVWIIFLLVAAVLELFLWLFQIDAIREPLNHTIATLPKQYWVAFSIWSGQCLTSLLLAYNDRNS